MPTRRDLLIGGIATALVPVRASAQNLSALELMVPSGPGGGWDQTARTMEFVLKTEGLVSETRVDHVLGGGGAVGLARFLSTKRGNGNALLVSGMVMVGALAANRSPVDLADAIAIARLTGEFEVIAVHRDSPIQTMEELAALLRDDPGGVSWAGGSAGGSDHILAGLVAKAAGADPRAISYVAYAGGGRAQASLLGNQVTCGVNGYAEFSEQISAGNLRALAISSAERQTGIDIPTLRESGIDVELSNWRGIFGAPGTRDDQRGALAGLIDVMVKTPAWRAELEKRDWTDNYLSGAPFAEFLADETSRITSILTEVGIVR